MNWKQATFNDPGTYGDAISCVARAREMLRAKLDLPAGAEIAG
ncbi:MAG: hypothetical protein QOH16_3088 [Gaiellaceae bacterium]|jgi:hypothetical protein|nr:hypothetical protein [Gaiellaceae bacterium]